MHISGAGLVVTQSEDSIGLLRKHDCVIVFTCICTDTIGMPPGGWLPSIKIPIAKNLLRVILLETFRVDGSVLLVNELLGS